MFTSLNKKKKLKNILKIKYQIAYSLTWCRYLCVIRNCAYNFWNINYWLSCAHLSTYSIVLKLLFFFVCLSMPHASIAAIGYENYSARCMAKDLKFGKMQKTRYLHCSIIHSMCMSVYEVSHTLISDYYNT